jgi:hypothetical protein
VNLADGTGVRGAGAAGNGGAMGRVLQRWNLCDKMGQTAARTATTFGGTSAFGASSGGAFHTSSRAQSDAATGAAAAGATSKESATDVDDGDVVPVVVRPPGERYEAALADTVRNVKLLSLASLAATVGSAVRVELYA